VLPPCVVSRPFPLNWLATRLSIGVPRGIAMVPVAGFGTSTGTVRPVGICVNVASPSLNSTSWRDM
jgi:hypothetical protein